MGLYCCAVLLTVLSFVCVSAVNYSRIDEGFSYGYLPDCPGSWKPAIITPKTIKKLTISVMDSVISWTPYNYYNIEQLAQHPGVDLKNKKTILYVPGYLDMNNLPIGRFLCEPYQNMGYNVLLLEALEFTARDFPIASRAIRAAGKLAAEMLAKLTTVGLDPKKLELIGISLGGQTMSFIAKNFRNITSRNVSAITALDPTGPCFRHLGPDQRLDPSDADFVLTVTTNRHGYGISSPVGHVTFYVNGGEYQPGEDPALPCSMLCSHIRSYSLWVSALQNPNKFIGVQCDSIQQASDGGCFDRVPMVTNTMDTFVDRSKPGIYYVATSNKYPFALGKKGLKRKQVQAG